MSCGDGEEFRNRTCVDPLYGGAPCVGESVEKQYCNPASCPGKGETTNDTDLSYDIECFISIISLFVVLSHINSLYILIYLYKAIFLSTLFRHYSRIILTAYPPCFYLFY